MKMRGPKRAALARAAVAALFAGVLAPSAVSAADNGAGGYVLTVQLPAALRKGVPSTLFLHVRQGARPVDRLVACLATAPLFVSMEDAMDTTPANGVDLGVGPVSSFEPGCPTAIAGIPSGSGNYTFTWEPDTAGHVNLILTAGPGALTVPVDVGSAPPNRLILTLFAAFVALVLGVAAYGRQRWSKAARP